MGKDSTAKNTTKSASRSWMLTVPAEHYSQEFIEEVLAPYGWIGQLEKGAEGAEDGYLHWQLYIENRTPVRFDTLKAKLPKAHLEPRKGTKWQAYCYVTKEETSQGVRVGSELFVIPEPDSQGRSIGVDHIRQKMIKGGKSFREIMLEEPVAAQHVNYARELEAALLAEKWGNTLRNVEVEYTYGPAGCGKTSSVYERFGFRDVYAVGSYSNPWDAYNGEPVVMLDEFRGQVEFEFLLKLLDRYPLRLPARYADRWAGFSRVILLSNLSLEDCYPWVRQESPQQWRALTRRIRVYQSMAPGGATTALPLPEPGEPASSKGSRAATTDEFEAMIRG